ncbi:MAG TPA: hypothetical protein VGO00_23160 [Kofleriaceae bacterium]|nr:hypothetical protein [Kofleriaceae bacterium]
MTTRARIGELLLAQQVVDEATLARALADQPTQRRRLCSILIARGVVHPDDAVRALAAQHEMAGALQRHLTGRDPALARLLPAELARAWMALPIGRMRGGELIVCVRDPSPELIPELERATQGPVMLAIAPASQLEALVASAYGRIPTGELDVNLETGLIAVIDDSTFQLVDLDDDRVAKMTQQIAIEAKESRAGMSGRPLDPPESARRPSEPPRPLEPRTMTPLPPRTTAPPPTQSPLPTRATNPPPDARQPIPVPRHELPERPSGPPAQSLEPAQRPSTRRSAEPPLRPSSPPAPSQWSTVPPPKATIALDHTLRALDRTLTRDDATDVVMAFVASRFPSSLLLAIKEGAAVGHRGHGPNVSDDAIQAIAVPLTSPTIVKLAHDSRRIATTTPPGTGSLQEGLERLLGDGPIAGPVFVSSRVACVLVVGADDLDALAGAELDRLTTALGVAYTRITLDAKKS